MALTRLAVSPYLCLADEVFLSDKGLKVVPIFLSDQAKLILVPLEFEGLLNNEYSDFNLDDPRVQELVRLGLISESREKFRQAHFERMTKASQPGPNRSFVLLPTSYCNMGCAYCGQAHIKSALTDHHRDSVLNRIIQTISDPGVASIHVGWFGGEPLMAFTAICSMSKRILQEIDKQKVDYSSKMTTNGALLDARKLRVLVKDCRINRFDITLDGPASIHDIHRPLKSGQPSFDRLTDFLADAVAESEYSDVNFVFRTNVDAENFRHIDEYLHIMANKGFIYKPNVIFQLSPIHEWGNDISNLKVGASDVARAEIEWFQTMHNLGLNFAALPSKVVLNTCVATNDDSEVIDSDGRIFSCTEQPLVPGTSERTTLTFIGNLLGTQRRPKGEYDSWSNNVTSGAIPCSRCWLLPVCGGCCPKRWGDGLVGCPSMKANLPARLSLVARNSGLHSLGPRLILQETSA